MAGPTNKRRRVEDEVRRPKKKVRKFKKQAEYHSSSEEDDEDAVAPIRRDATFSDDGLSTKSAPRRQQEADLEAAEQHESEDEELDAQQQADQDDSENEELDETAINTALNVGAHESEEDDLDGPSELDDDEPELSSDDDSDAATTDEKAKKKRNDPEAFATSISKILTTKLTTQKRADPILSRSKTADEANKALADDKLETKARAAIRAEKKSLLERGRVKDVLGFDTPGIDTGAIQEEEKRLKKIAQRGVVKLFNAVRAAQVRAEEAESKAKAEGVVGMRKREDRVNEMSKEGFLDLISRGGKQATTV